MEPKFETDHRLNQIGSAWMVAAMAAFAVEDSFIKVAADRLPVGQILTITGLAGVLFFGSIAKLNGERLLSEDAVSRPMRVRMLFEISGRLFYVLAISLIPLSAATVILQAAPLVVVAGAALIFGETVGYRRWLAVFVGLIGVIVVVGPCTDSFSMLSILAVIGMLGFAGRDLASRAAPVTLSTSILGLYGFLAILIAGGIFTAWTQAPFVWASFDATQYLVASVLSGVTAYFCLMKALRTGEISAVVPFRYSRLLIGIAFGVLLFGERLSIQMLVGSALIVISGLFILGRGIGFQPVKRKTDRNIDSSAN